MIHKDQIIGVLIDEGLSVIESNRTLDTVENFRDAIKDIESKAIADSRE